MSWSTKLLRTPTWPLIAMDFMLGLVMLTVAVLEATRYAAQVATHGDALFTVALAALGGLAIGSGIGGIRQRAAMRHTPGINPVTPA